MIRINVKKKLNMEDGMKILSVDTEIFSGEFVVIFGPSGAGKTSLLRMISGLLKPEQGRIEFEGETWFDRANKINLPVQRREIGFVFQDLALFPNMTVKENLLYAAGQRKDYDYINHLLQITGLKSLSQRKPQTLSGGQQQRAAIIRALARKPRLLLLDEPFSALDVAMRHQLRKELKAIHKEFCLTILLVSHDTVDIHGLADRYLEIKEGRIITTVHSGADHDSTDIQNCFKGEVLKINKSEGIYILEILYGEIILKLPVSKEDATTLKPGISVLISSEKFYLHIQPLI